MTTARARFASSMTLRSASRGSPQPTKSAADPLIISDADMAWALADSAGSCLTEHERTMTFVELGCGEEHLAIARVLAAVASSRMALPEAVLAPLADWLHSYADNPAQTKLHKALAEISRQQHSEALSTSQHDLCDDQPMRHGSAHSCGGGSVRVRTGREGSTHT